MMFVSWLSLGPGCFFPWAQAGKPKAAEKEEEEEDGSLREAAVWLSLWFPFTTTPNGAPQHTYAWFWANYNDVTGGVAASAVVQVPFIRCPPCRSVNSPPCNHGS